jgi:hypothetical protein
MPDAELLGTTSDFFGLVRIMRARAEALPLSREKLEDLAGFPSGYCNKLLTDPPAKNMGITSLGKLLKGLALKLQVVEDRAQMERNAPHFGTRREQQVRNAPPLDAITAYKIYFVRTGARAAFRSTTPEQRRANGRAAANFRWHGNANGKANGNT